MSRRIDWTAVEIIELPPEVIAACRECGGTSWKLNRSLKVEGDGSHAVQSICKSCGTPKLIIKYPPTPTFGD